MTMLARTYSKVIVIDGKGHLCGRLASIVSKHILSGFKVVVVRCEDINISGSFFRNKIRYHAYLRKRCVVNPQRGPFHFRAPSRIFYKAVRGMIPHKSVRGTRALERLKVFEGIPAPYSTMRRVVVPEALRVVRLAPGRKFTNLGRIAQEVGWKYQGVVAKLEEKRMAKASVYFQRKKSLLALKNKALEAKKAELSNVQGVLSQHGF